MRLELKLRVVLAFIFRLPLIAIAIVHLRYIKATPQTNLPLAIIPAATIESIQLGYSLFSATIPNLKSFIMSFDTAMMMDIGYKLHSSSAQSNTITGQARQGSAVSKPQRHSDDIHDHYLDIGSLRPERLEHFTNIQHVDTWSMSKDDISIARASRESQDRTIRRDMQWKVEETFATP